MTPNWARQNRNCRQNWNFDVQRSIKNAFRIEFSRLAQVELGKRVTRQDLSFRDAK